MYRKGGTIYQVLSGKDAAELILEEDKWARRSYISEELGDTNKI